MKDTLFFDGQCAMCSKEILYLKRLMDDELELVDIHTDPRRNQASQYSDQALLSVLHFQTKDGSWLLGLDATVAAWQHTHYGFILRPLRWPIIKPIADWVYYRWANNRACKLGYQ